MKKTIDITEKQLSFIEADENEVLFGGAAGGGKSMAQVLDCAAFAVRYPESRQLVLRRTLPELEKTLIRAAMTVLPRDIYSYIVSRHEGRFTNGSIVEFGYCDSENDVFRYQSAEYDVVRFDELTHFTEFMYLYLMSRVRGANGYPKQMKSTTNPGGVGHSWVKSRFIDIGEYGRRHVVDGGTRIFLPSHVSDNLFLMKSDADYKRRLELLPERERRALLLGEWELSAGRFFPEFGDKHIVRPFSLPDECEYFFAMDYGLDMLAGLFIAVTEKQGIFVIDEIYESGLTAGNAAMLIKSYEYPVRTYIAPPDLWNRGQESGRSAADLFAQKGVFLEQVRSSRENGWLALKELLLPHNGENNPKLRVFASCKNLKRTLGAISVDGKNPNDAARQPHELTHAPDALRYFAAYRYEKAGSDSVEDSSLVRLLRYGI